MKYTGWSDARLKRHMLRELRAMGWGRTRWLRHIRELQAKGWSRPRLKRHICEVLAVIADLNKSTAFHEAGHAIIAIRLRVGLVYATLKPEKRAHGFSAGHVSTRRNPQRVMGYPLWFWGILPRRIFKDASPYLKIAKRQHAKKSIVVSCAGAEAQKLFAEKLTPDVLKSIAAGARSDERDISSMRRAHRIPESVVERLRRKAATLVRTHRRAIHAVSRVLLRAGDRKVSAKTIRSICKRGA